MARVIVMDRELHEPITIVEVPANLMREVEKGRRHLRFMLPPKPVPFYGTPIVSDDVVQMLDLETATLEFEPVGRGTRGEIIFWYAYAQEPELALLLRAAFLPGQVAENQRLKKEAYMRGVFDTVFGPQ